MSSCGKRQHVAPDRFKQRNIAAVEPWTCGNQADRDLLSLRDGFRIGDLDIS